MLHLYLIEGKHFIILHVLIEKKTLQRKFFSTKFRKDNFCKNTDLVTGNELSMISTEYVVLFVSKLRFICDSNKLFSEKHALLSSNFLQMQSVFCS